MSGPRRRNVLLALPADGDTARERLDELILALQAADFDVEEACEPDRARVILQDGWTDLAVIGRLKKVSPLELARQAPYLIPKILIISDPSKNQPNLVWLMHESNVLDVLRHGRPEEVIQAVQRAFATMGQKKVDWDLSIERCPHHDGAVSLDELVAGLLPEDQRGWFAARVHEMDHLLRRLFSGYSRVFLGAPAWHRGELKALPIEVQKAGRPKESFLLVAGCLSAGEADRLGYDLLQSWGAVSGGFHLEVGATSPRFEAHIFRLVGAFPSRLRSLADLYREQPDVAAKILQTGVLAQVKTWPEAKEGATDTSEHAGAAFPPHLGFFDTTGLQTGLAEALPKLYARLQAAGLLHPETGGAWRLTLPRQPAHWLSSPDDLLTGAEESQAAHPLVLGLFRLSGDTILVDPLGRVFLTEHRGTARAPAWMAAAQLEAEMRFDWPVWEDLPWRAALEDCLAGQGFVPLPDPACPQMHLLNTIRPLREWAKSALSGDFRPYHQALYYHAAARIVQGESSTAGQSLDLPRSAHLALALHQMAVLLAQPVPVPACLPVLVLPEPNEAGQPPVLKLSGQQVLLWGRPLTYGKTMGRLLLHLLAHPGEFFTREQLLPIVYQIQARDVGDLGHLDDLTTLINRLRRKLAEASQGWNYLEYHQGTGYTLRNPPLKRM